MAKSGDKCEFTQTPIVHTADIPKHLQCVPGLREMEMPHDYYIYFLVREDRVVYVGQTKNIYTRLSWHKSYTKHDRAFFFQCYKSEADRLEHHWTAELNPKAHAQFFFERDILPGIQARANAKVG